MAAPPPDVPVQVGMAPFVATVSEPTPLPDGHVGLLVNCGLHASRVVFNMMSTMSEQEKIKTLHDTRILGAVMNLTEHPDLRLQIIAGKIVGHFPNMPGLSQTW